MLVIFEGGHGSKGKRAGGKMEISRRLKGAD